MSAKYKQKYTIEERREESVRLRTKYPNRIPVIIDKERKSKLPELEKFKFLIPADLTISYLYLFVRDSIKMSPQQAIFFLCNKTPIATTATICEIFQLHRESDNFLYIQYTEESTFGDLVQCAKL